MPLTQKGKDIMRQMVETYGNTAKAKEVFYASKNAGKITGVDAVEEMPSGTPVPVPDVNVSQAQGIGVDALPRCCAGIIFCTKDERVLLMRRTGRDFPDTWALPGGGMEDDETAEECARRELTEETGFKYKGELLPWTRRVRDGIDFTTFIAPVDDAFEVTLNEEHDAYQWVDREFALAAMPVLHPGMQIVLLRFDMDELGIAKAMRSGEISSPQRYGNMLLIAIRITGTGAAYRNGIDEFVWRDPSLYLNSDFLERCQGLSVILAHPKKDMLDTKEYRSRNVGSIMLPYIQGDEVWGIARIMDMKCAEMLETEKLSTSPCVVFFPADAGARYPMGSSSLLIEGKPSLLDHVAICAQGVWDKGGDPAGVSSASVEPAEIDSKLDAALSMVRHVETDAVLRQLGV